MCCLALAAAAARAHGIDTTEAHAVSEESWPPPQRREAATATGGSGVYRARVEPHWLAGNTAFWYRNDLRGGTKEFILVEAEQGIRRHAFDHERLAAALARATQRGVEAGRLPFEAIRFVDGENAIEFEAFDRGWRCGREDYVCVALTEKPKATEAPAPPTGGDASNAGRPRGRGRGNTEAGPLVSPDGQWAAWIQNFNVLLRAAAGGAAYELTLDGATNNAYGRLEWSPDSKTLAAWRIEAGDYNPVYLLESSPPGGGLARMTERHYEQPGNKLPSHELNLFEAATRRRIQPEVEPVDFGWPVPRWETDGSRFTYEKVDRGHQRFRVIEIDARTGAARTLIDERSDTFIWTAHAESYLRRGVRPVFYLEKTRELILASEKDGWRHLYLVNRDSGRETRITGGAWVVRGIERIDEERRQIWFEASGMNPEQDPYFIHYYRVNFDGSGLVALTGGNGTHSVAFSPDRRFLIDTYSRVDLPPVHELRRTSDGGLLCRLEEADISELRERGWRPPIIFTAKGRDGVTDIWGLIYPPAEIQPDRKYPVIEDIYAGPHDSYTPKAFSAGPRYESYTRLGFVVVKLDAMGTANRSKAFHDVAWKNLKDAGFPDRILWIRAAAAKHPYLDLDRVGIFGTSAGGQNAAAAVLFHADFYKAAVANCGCHDNRIDKRSWNEQWMGYVPKEKIYEPGPDNGYAASSNIDQAARLGGKLLLIVGELDTNVPPESTHRFADALIRAGKDFEYLVVPGEGHGIRLDRQKADYAQRRTREFFVRHFAP